MSDEQMVEEMMVETVPIDLALPGPGGADGREAVPLTTVEWDLVLLNVLGALLFIPLGGCILAYGVRAISILLMHQVILKYPLLALGILVPGLILGVAYWYFGGSFHREIVPEASRKEWVLTNMAVNGVALMVGLGFVGAWGSLEGWVWSFSFGGCLAGFLVGMVQWDILQRYYDTGRRRWVVATTVAWIFGFTVILPGVGMALILLCNSMMVMG